MVGVVAVVSVVGADRVVEVIRVVGVIGYVEVFGVVEDCTSNHHLLPEISWRYERIWGKIFKAPDFEPPASKYWYLEGLS